MLASYGFFVTRPFAASVWDVLTPALACWHVAAAAGLWIWLRQDRPRAVRFATPLLIMSGLLCLQTFLRLEWAPLQFPRFQAILNLLLALPVGIAGCLVFAAVGRGRLEFDLKSTVGVLSRTGSPSAAAFALRWLLLALIWLNLLIFARPSIPALAFFPPRPGPIDELLEFAQTRSDGLYLVELPDPAFPAEGFDARAIAALLGRQGNQSATVVYREASPNSLFFAPLANSISAFPDNFGISSTLADDLSFAASPWERKLLMSDWIGVRYLVLISTAAKANVAAQGGVRIGDFGSWSVFRMENAEPKARLLNSLPALVVGRPSFKLRNSNQIDATRLAEEQFFCACFEVSLAFAPEKGLDDLEDLDSFGALIVADHHTRDVEAAYSKLRAFSRRRLLVLLPSDHPLQRRIRANRDEFPNLLLVRDHPSTADRPINSLEPTFDYTDSPGRLMWNEIRRELERLRVPIENASQAEAEIGAESIRVRFRDDAPKPGRRVPVLVAVTFSPYWRRSDGEPVYATTPFLLLTFAEGEIRLDFRRRRLERVAAYCAAIALASLPLLWMPSSVLAARLRRISTNRRPPVAGPLP